MVKRISAYLSVVFAIFWRDVKRMVHNPIALIIVAGACLLPSAYAWYCIAANWDPYNNTSSMKVAVANEDKGATSKETGEIHVGDQVVAKLHDNDQLGWVYVDKQQAIDGVYSGDYWAALVIPENFSEDFTSVFTGSFTRPTIDYYVNEKPSSVAPKVTDAGAEAVEEAVNESFVETVTEKVVAITQSMGAYTEKKGEQSERTLTTGVEDARDAVAQTRKTLEGLGGTMNRAKEALGSADDALGTLEEEVPKLSEALAHAKTLLSGVRKTTDEAGTALAGNATKSATALGAAAASAQRAAGAALGDATAAQATTAAALTDAQALGSANDRLIASLESQAPGNPQIASALANLRRQNVNLGQTVSDLKGINDNLGTTVKALTAASSAVTAAADEGTSTVTADANSFTEKILPAVESSLDALVSACGTLEGTVAAMGPQVKEARAMLAELDGTLGTSMTAIKTTAASLGATEQSLEVALTDLRSLQDSAVVKELERYLQADGKDVGSFMAAPVSLKTVEVYPVKNYGSGVTPFYTNLALWVAGFILMAIVRMRVDPEGLPPFTARQAYFGRWLFYVAMGFVQGLIVTVGDLLLGIQCENPAAFIGAGLLTVFVDVNLMFALAYAFRHIGKALAVILLIMQIPGSSGMFPVEMMPPFFNAINPLLPFTYSIDAMREAIGGFYGWDYLKDMLWLGLLFIPLGFFIGLVLGRYDYNLNLLFDRKLGATDLFVSEKVPGGTARYRNKTLVRSLLENDDFRRKIQRRFQWFQDNYLKLVRIGWALLFVQPLATLCVMVLLKADVNTKVMLLVWMVVGILVVNAYLIVITYVNTNVKNQQELLTMDPEQLRATAVAGTVSNNAGSGVQPPAGRGESLDRKATRHDTGSLDDGGSDGGDHDNGGDSSR